MPVRSDAAGLTITGTIGPATIATDTNTDSSAVDLKDYPGYRVGLRMRVGTRTDGTFTPVLVSSSDDGGNDAYAAVAAFSGSVTAVSAATTERISWYQPTERYVKARVTSASTTSGAMVTAHLILVPPSF